MKQSNVTQANEWTIRYEGKELTELWSMEWKKMIQDPERFLKGMQMDRLVTKEEWEAFKLFIHHARLKKVELYEYYDEHCLTLIHYIGNYTFDVNGKKELIHYKIARKEWYTETPFGSLYDRANSPVPPLVIWVMQEVLRPFENKLYRIKSSWKAGRSSDEIAVRNSNIVVFPRKR